MDAAERGPGPAGPGRPPVWPWVIIAAGVLVLLAAVGWTAVRHLEVRGAVLRCVESRTSPSGGEKSSAVIEREIAGLGGSDRALGRLRAYVRRSGLLAPEPWAAKVMICSCGVAARGDMQAFLDDRDRRVREAAAVSLGELGAPVDVQLLISVAQGFNRPLALRAAVLLGNMGAAAEPAVPGLIRLSTLVWGADRDAVFEALEKILGRGMVLRVVVAQDGTYSVGGNAMSLEALGRVMAESAGRGCGPDGLTKLAVVIECHRMAKYKHAQAVMIKCMDNKVHQVSFAVTGPAEAPAREGP